MKDRLVVIETYGDPVAAQAARSALEMAGIRAIVADEQVAINLRHLSSGLKGAELLVHAADLERATQVLMEAEEAAEKEPRHGEWHCPQCKERVPGEFDECWSCGQAYDSTQHPAASVTRTDEHDDYEVDVDVDVDPETGPPATMVAGWRCFSCGSEVRPHTTKCLDCGADAGLVNPYIPATTPAYVASTSPDANKLAEKALMAAFMGLMCPVVLTVWSMYFILQILASGEPLNGRGRMCLTMAIIIDLAIVTIQLCILGMGMLHRP